MTNNDGERYLSGTIILIKTSLCLASQIFSVTKIELGVNLSHIENKTYDNDKILVAKHFPGARPAQVNHKELLSHSLTSLDYMYLHYYQQPPPPRPHRGKPENLLELE